MKDPMDWSDEEFTIATGANKLNPKPGRYIGTSVGVFPRSPAPAVPLASLRGGLKWNETKIGDFEDPDSTQQLQAHPPTPEEAFAAKMRRKRGEGAKEEQYKALSSMSSIEFGGKIHRSISDKVRALTHEFHDPGSPLYGWRVGESQGVGKVSITPPNRLPNALQADAAQARLHELLMGGR